MVSDALIKMDDSFAGMYEADITGGRASVFTKNRERLSEHDAIIGLFNRIVETADDMGWLSGEDFSVDGTLIQACASHRGCPSGYRASGCRGHAPVRTRAPTRRSSSGRARTWA